MSSKLSYLTRDEAISRCEKSQPDRYEYNMFIYQRWDHETVVKCKGCGHRSLITPEQIWRSYRSNCPKPGCKYHR